jgi:hypothetical protein
MSNLAKTITWDELVKINENEGIDKSYVGYDIYKDNNVYVGRIIKVSSDKIIVDTTRYKNNKVSGVAI